MIGKRTKYVIYNVFRYIINILISKFPRDNNICVLNCMNNATKRQNGFSHNTKFLYLYMSSHPEKNLIPIWISADKNIINELRKKGYRAYFKYSFLGIYFCLRAKYYILNIDIMSNEIFNCLIKGSFAINLWHGIPLKHIGRDSRVEYYKLKNWQKKIYEFLLLKNDYIIANSDYDANIYKSAFLMEEKNIKKLGSPRLDSLFQEIKDEDMFMKTDIDYIKQQKQSNKKIILYAPTFRDTGKSFSEWVLNTNLKKILEENNAILICKLHPVDKSSLIIKNTDEIYKMNNSADINVILKYTDALITDYSSVAFDYLLLDKPILYYVPDFEEYQKTCHEFYTPYQDYAVGDVAKNEDELLQAMGNMINGIDNYKEKRKILRDKMFVYQDSKNCERVVDWIKNLE